MRDQVSADPAELADLLTRVLAAGDPLRSIEGLFGPRTRAVAPQPPDLPADLLELAARATPGAVEHTDYALPLFDLIA